MSENKNPLNDFLEMEENGTDPFDSLPFSTPVPESFVQNAPAQPQASAAQDIANAPAQQMQPQSPFAQPKYVYCVHISAEANTITIKPNESRVYYSSPHKAVAAYQSVLNNLRITPVYSKGGRIPDNLDMKFGELPEIEDRCAGTEIRYLLPGATPKTVTVEVIRCPIEEEFDDVRE